MKLKQTLLVATIAAFAANTALADTDVVSSVPQAFTNAEVASLFESDAGQSLQLAALSAQEMRETEGAWVANAVGGALGAVAYGSTCLYSRCTPAGFGLATVAGAFNPVHGINSAIWGFNGTLATGTLWGVGGRAGWW